MNDRQGNLVPDLSEKLVGIVGLGMHGSLASLLIARLGVGRMILIDPDVVDIHNITNQLYPIFSNRENKVNATADFISHMSLKVPSFYVYRNRLEEVDYIVRHCNVLVCCADSFETRKAAALAACKNNVNLFIESRSAMNTAFIHSFKPTADKVDVYLSTCFPESVEPVSCGDTGTSAMGAMVGAEIAASIMFSRGGEAPELIPEEKIITLGYGIQIKMVVFDKNLVEEN